MKLIFREGFEHHRLAWGRPDSPVRELCAYCHAKLPEAPLMMWNNDGYCISLCDDCLERWVTTESKP
jgi:hypothetical protein